MIVFGFGYVAENVRKCIWQNAFGLRGIRVSGHGVRFAGTRLAVRQYSAIIAFQHFVDNWTSRINVEINLRKGEKC